MANVSRMVGALCILGLGVSCSGGGGGSGSPLVVLTPVFFAGASNLSGTVTLPPDSASGRLLSFEIDQVSPSSGSELRGNVSTTSAHEVRFRVAGLQDGTYQIRMRVDQTGDGALGPGDYDGWYDGTVASPILDQGSAAIVTVAGADQSGLDFGLGLVP